MEQAKVDSIAGWFAGRLPDGWFAGAPSVTTDDKQILVVGTLEAPSVAQGASADVRAGAEGGRIARFREETRGYRIHIAREAERKFELPVTWGAVCGSTNLTFTPGGSGRRQEGEGGDEPRKVMIGWRGPWRGSRRMRHWQRF